MNFTDHILQSATYFAFGILIYFFLSLLIVHILCFLQKKVYLYQVSKEKPFKGYLRMFLKDIVSKPTLFSNTIRYILPLSKTSYPVMDNDKIERWIAILKSFRNYVKPFIICATIFEILKYAIAKKIAYNALTIILPKVQNFIAYLDSLTLLNWAFDHKLLMNLFLGLLIIIVPFLFYRKKKSQNIKKKFNQLLIYIAILTNVTFFGVELSKFHHKETEKLIALEFRIENIHNRIYDAIRTDITKDIWREEIENEVETDKKNITKIETKLPADVKSIRDKTLKDSLVNELNNLIRIAKYSKVITDWEAPKKYKEKTRNDYKEEFKEFYESYKKDRKKASSIDYFANKEKWNIKDGETLQKEVAAQIEKNKKTRLRKFSKNSKEYAVLQEFYSFVTSLGINELSSYIEIENKDIFKKVAKSITTFKKPLILKGIVNFFTKTPIIDKDVASIDKNTIKDELLKSYKKIVNKYKEKQYYKQENKRLQQQIKSEIEKLLLNDVTSRVEKVNYSLANPLPAKKILKEYKKEIQKIYSNIIRYPNSSNVKKYNTYLKQQVPKTKTIATNGLKTIFKNIPIICPCCFRNIQTAERCIPINPICI